MMKIHSTKEYKDINNIKKHREFKDIECIIFTDKEGRKCNIYTVDKVVIDNKNIDLYLKKDGLFEGKFVDISQGSMIIVTKDQVVKLYNVNKLDKVIKLNESNLSILSYTSSAGEDGYFYYISNRDFNKYPSRCLLNVPTAKELRRRTEEAIIKKLDNIKVKRVPRTNHLVKQALNVTKNMYDTNAEGFIKVLRKLDENLVGERFVYLVKGLSDEDIVYSDTFVENMLKKQAIKHLQSEDNRNK